MRVVPPKGLLDCRFYLVSTNHYSEFSPLPHHRNIYQRMKRYYTILSIAGSDSSGGAGIQADIKAAAALGVYGMTAITAITAQNTTGVTAIQGIAADVVATQIDAVFSDIRPQAVKTGMLYSAEIVDVVADKLIEHNAQNIVIDPVMVSTSGSLLIAEDAIDTLVKRLFPIATLITPNVAEARKLTNAETPTEQAQAFHSMGANAVLLKGGDNGNSDIKIDYLSISGNPIIELSMPAIDTRNTHGTGCTLSSAIASYLAMGKPLIAAVTLAKSYIYEALQAGSDISCGSGHGPVNHFYNPQPLQTYSHENQA